ncbi:MAG: ABC transporter ATP-binding protein/permease [Victivallaceae bacterium]|nr:ABC transporter ATP-binding protein/permease [Victivallaceae bacterium]
MGRKKVNFDPDIKRQSYLRLLKYTRKYWGRLTVGIIAGLVVGGSLLGSLLLLPQLISAVAPDAKNGKGLIVAQEVVEQLNRQQFASEAERIKVVDTIINPVDHDPKMTKSLKSIEDFTTKVGLPVKVSKTELNWNGWWSFSLPIADEQGKMSWQFFAIYVIAFIVGWTLKNIATYINRYYTRWVGTKVVADLRNEVFDKLLGQSMKFYSKIDIGQLISRCTNDTSAIESSIATTVADATRCPIEIAACVAAIIIIGRESNDYSLLAILFIGLPVCILPIVILGKKIRKIYRSSFKAIANVVSRMHEVFTGISVIKAYHTEKKESNYFRGVNRKYFRTMIRALKLQLLMSPLMESVAVGATLVFLIYSYQRGVTVTELAVLLVPAFMAYKPIKSLAKVTTYLQRSMAAADRYFALIDTDTGIKERENPVILESFKDAVVFNKVKFAYEDKMIIDNLDLEIKRGSVVAVVGETGSGKTTIANLIARFYDVNSGQVTIDGVDIKDFEISSLRQHIGIVSQNTILFNDTIAHNIAYGCESATPEMIENAAKQANAHQFIVDGRHSNGYDTVVGDKGSKLSGGEKQRIAIARAILKNPPILILDEATSALDTVTERLVQDALNNVMENRTVFAIAHRLSTIKHADKIIVLDQGKIIESGTHDELLGQGGTYKKLHDTQFDR